MDLTGLPPEVSEWEQQAIAAAEKCLGYAHDLAEMMADYKDETIVAALGVLLLGGAYHLVRRKKSSFTR